MLETSARLLRLLSLLQSRRSWTGSELAERLGTTDRTVRRDIDKLRALGYPVDAAVGVAGGYQLGPGAELPPLLLDDEEAIAVAVGLRTAAGVSRIAETSVRAMAKLEQVLPARLRHRVNALHEAVVALDPVHADTGIDPQLLTLLAGACRDHEQLRLDYSSRSGEASLRVVEPYRLVRSARLWYLVAFDLDRSDWRTFRVDRMRPWTPPGPRFVPREAPEDVAGYVSQSVSTSPYRYQARILMHAPIDVVARSSSPAAGRLEPVDENTCVLHTGSNSLEQLALHVGVKGVEFTVLDPPELVEQLRVLARRFAAAAERSPG